MGQMKIAGAALIVLGLGLAYWGYQESGSLGSQMNELVKGSPGDTVMMKYIGGAVAAVAGGLLLARK